MKPHIERSIGAAATHTFPVAVLNEQGKIESANSKFIEITGFTEQELSFGKTIQINDTKSQSEPFSLTKIGGDACWEGD
ncbi:MAG: PAS domain-containing protein, partial [Bacteroidia bacterium]